MPEDDFYALLRREKLAAGPAANAVREIEATVASMKERGAEAAVITLALKHVLALREKADG